MGFTKPDKPTKLRGARGSLTINTRGVEKDSAGAYKPTTNTAKSDIPCTLTVMSPAEVMKLGKDSDVTMYRIRLPIRHQDGSNIRITHGQDVTVTCNQYPSGADMVCVGTGKHEGQSGIQTVIARVEDR